MSDLLKRCTICKEPRLKSSFGKNNAKKDGLQTFCKDCSKILNKRRSTKGGKHFTIAEKRKFAVEAFKTKEKYKDMPLKDISKMIGISDTSTKKYMEEYKKGSYDKKIVGDPLVDKNEFIKNIPKDLTKKYSVDILELITDDIINYCDRTGKTYENYYKALRYFIKNSTKLQSHIEKENSTLQQQILDQVIELKCEIQELKIIFLHEICGSKIEADYPSFLNEVKKGLI